MFDGLLQMQLGALQFMLEVGQHLVFSLVGGDHLQVLRVDLAFVEDHQDVVVFGFLVLERMCRQVDQVLVLFTLEADLA
ncbi:hypothetical protein D3C76_1495600 [compost metagenome]